MLLLFQVGVDYGLRDVGTITQRWMRIEKFIPLWGEDLNSFTTPFECGSGYRVKLDVSIAQTIIMIFFILKTEKQLVKVYYSDWLYFSTPPCPYFKRERRNKSLLCTVIFVYILFYFLSNEKHHIYRRSKYITTYLCL